MAQNKKKGLSVTKLGIIFFIVMVVSFVWVAVSSLWEDENPDDVTWVG